MPGYSSYAPFYDPITDGLRQLHGQDVNKFRTRAQATIRRHMPHASSLLELGCGTGAVLAGFPDLPSLTGLDLSPQMLAIARSKVPAATFEEADMANFSLGRQFDVVICVFDTLNHLITFDQWTSLFECVHEHLAADGIFIFDVLTPEGMRRAWEELPFVFDFDRNTAVATNASTGGSLAIAEMRVFEHLEDDRFVLHREQIRELAVPLEQLTAALEPCWKIVELTDWAGETPDGDPGRAFFVAAKR